MATIKDVAKRANVSTTTVSHVINKTRFVAEETRNAVWAAIKELHYSPSAVARSLKVNHTKSIGLLATSKPIDLVWLTFRLRATALGE
ncbi:hypothetical protein BU67_10475 [Escherichia coli]|nr:hypothetical protein BU67_10475 [Escherichia coli]